MEYKKTYTKEEVNEVITWFRQHQDMLPDTLQLNASTVYKDFKKTIELYFDIALAHHEKPCYGGQIYHLFQIREKLIELYGFDKD